MKKFLLVATVVKGHVNTFHIPVLEMMKKSGYEVHVIARNNYERSEDCIIPFCDKYYDLPFEREPIRKNNIKSYFQLKEIIDKEDYDIIHCHTPVGGALTRLAARNSRKKGTKVVYTAHGFHFFKGAPLINWLIYYPIEKILSKYTDSLVTINSEDYKISKKMYAKNVFYIPGVGISLDKYKEKIDINKKRNDLGISNNDFVLISVGELNKNKNHRAVIESLVYFKEENIKYIICGEGPLFEKLTELVEKLDLSDNVIFLGYRNDINELLQISNVFVFPSFREGLSLSVMEAMATGLPCLVSETRGNTDLIDNNKGGYTFDLKNPNDIVEKLDLIMKQQSDLQRFGNYNLEKIKKYGIDSVLEKKKSIYKYF